MQLLRLGGIGMSKNSVGVSEGFTSSSPQPTVRNQGDQQEERLLNSGDVNFAKKSGLKTSTSSLTHSNTSKFYFYAVALVLITFAFSSYVDMYGVSAMPRCAPCPGGECPEPPEGSCLFGVITNFCGRRVCAKGPGEVCGTGMFKMLGTCADGLYCNCGRCNGCGWNGVQLQCYDRTCT